MCTTGRPLRPVTKPRVHVRDGACAIVPEWARNEPRWRCAGWGASVSRGVADAARPRCATPRGRDPRPAAAARASRRADARPASRIRRTSAPRPRSSHARGIEVIRVERGGEVTYHGPGQLVAYPIIRLAERGLLLRPFVRALEQSMIDTAAGYGVDAGRRDGFPGCWCDAGRRPRHARSARSGCASRAASAITASPST